jgi:hypothetical protein
VAYRVTTGQDYADLASGTVLQSAPRFPAFPVRLAQEIFLRGLAFVPQTKDGTVSLWDPCSGSGYLATVLSLLNRAHLHEIVCSDADPDALVLARKNLRLTTLDGLSDRAATLRHRAAEFDKPGYSAAADAAGRLSDLLSAGGGDLPHRSFLANALDPDALADALPPSTPNLVITDVPYGRQTDWIADTPSDAAEFVPRMVDALSAVLHPDAVIAICAQARKVDVGEGRHILTRFRLGARAIAILRPHPTSR